ITSFSHCPLAPSALHSFPTRRSSDLQHITSIGLMSLPIYVRAISTQWQPKSRIHPPPACSKSQNHSLCGPGCVSRDLAHRILPRSEEHTSELQSRENLVCRLLLEKKK